MMYIIVSTQIRIGDAMYGLTCIEVEQAGVDCRGGCPCPVESEID